MTIPVCPKCSTPATDLHQPDIVKDEVSPGDLYLCGSCAHLATFKDEHTLVTMSDKKIRDLSEDELKDIRFAVREIIAQKNRAADDAQHRALGIAGKRF